MQRRFSRRRGFAILEVIVSLEVLALGIVPIVALYPAVLGAMSTGIRKSAAARIAESALEEAVRIDYPELVPEALGPVVKQEASWPETLQFTRLATVDYVNPTTLAPAGYDTGLKKVTVTVTWLDRGRQQNLTISLLRSAYE